MSVTMAWPGTRFLPPTPMAKRWVEKAVGNGAEVIRVRRLSGGTASAVHAVDVRVAGGTALRLVLRRHLLFSFLQEEPDVAEREARKLQLLERAGIAAPRLVAVDPSGDECDVPAVLMTRMPGQLELKPGNLDLWLRRMAGLLPPIHAIDPRPFHVQEWKIWDDLRKLDVPAWSSTPRVWTVRPRVQVPGARPIRLDLVGLSLKRPGHTRVTVSVSRRSPRG